MGCELALLPEAANTQCLRPSLQRVPGSARGQEGQCNPMGANGREEYFPVAELVQAPSPALGPRLTHGAHPRLCRPQHDFNNFPAQTP